MALATPTLTADDLIRLPDDGSRYELVRGELHKMPPAGFEHGSLAVRFTWRLAQFVEKHDLGIVTAAETGFLLSTDPDTVLAPDAAFVRKDRLPQEKTIKGYWPGAPDLAVEVVSPNDTHSEVEAKAMEWLKVGCRAVVTLNPRNRTVTVYRSLEDIVILSEESALDISDVVPDWTVPVRELLG
jgi:Uma2 family endonuclease